MAYICGTHRSQQTLFPECLEDYILKNNPVRAIDSFVECLDLESLGFQRAIPSQTGRPGYHPGDIIKLYLYGYLHRIRSSRGLEKETHRNVELMWLIKRLNPDFKTIADFRKNNSDALKKTVRQFAFICKDMGLYGAQLIAIDGSKFQGVNNHKKVIKQKHLGEFLVLLDEMIQQYFDEVKKNDDSEGITVSELSKDLTQKLENMETKCKEIQKALETLDKVNAKKRKVTESAPDSHHSIDKTMTKRKDKALKNQQLKESDSVIDKDCQKQKFSQYRETLKKAIHYMESNDETHIGLTDPESKLMKNSGRKLFNMGYNIQIAVDSKHGLIVDHKVTNSGNDQGMLAEMALSAKAILDVESTEVIADKGYYNYRDLKTCADNNIITYVKEQRHSNNASKNMFTKYDFTYDPDSDTYTCPANQVLKPVKARSPNGKKKNYTTKECISCLQRDLCTNNKRGRYIERSPYEDFVEKNRERMEADPAKMNKRMHLAESPFGILKKSMGYSEFLTKGLESVKAEISLSMLAMNFKKALNVLGPEQIISFMGNMSPS